MDKTLDKWTAPYCGVSHLEGISRGQIIRQVTIRIWEKFTELTIFGPTGFTGIVNKTFRGKDHTERAKRFAVRKVKQLLN